MRKAALVLLAICLTAGAAWAASMNIQVREVDVKSAPNYLSASVGKLNYGDNVQTGDEQGSWVMISSPSGWVPKSAITKSKVKANPDEKFAGRGASHDETALAGKGFNPQVEAEYKKQNPGMAAAYSKVDWLEEQTISLPALKAFATAGRLEQ